MNQERNLNNDFEKYLIRQIIKKNPVYKVFVRDEGNSINSDVSNIVIKTNFNSTFVELHNNSSQYSFEEGAVFRGFLKELIEREIKYIIDNSKFEIKALESEEKILGCVNSTKERLDFIVCGENVKLQINESYEKGNEYLFYDWKLNKSIKIFVSLKLRENDVFLINTSSLNLFNQMKVKLTEKSTLKNIELNENLVIFHSNKNKIIGFTNNK